MNLQHFRKELARTLAARDLSQFEFARKHGFSYSSINKFLNGQLNNPRLSTIHAIEKAIAAEARAS